MTTQIRTKPRMYIRGYAKTSFNRIQIGGGILALLLGLCIITLPWTLSSSSNLYYDRQHTDFALRSPSTSTFGSGSAPASSAKVSWANASPAG